MIELKEKKDCCGCGACVQKCPKNSIILMEDNEGFMYPHINLDTCIDCGLCNKVCPVVIQSEVKKPLKVYAAKSCNEEVRRQSSSGGVFTHIAEDVIKRGGVVFGAKFNNNWEVVHSYCETIEGLAKFRGSKYVQSIIGDSYKEAQSFLKAGRIVLYSGTPCQIAGLKLFLGKKYDNLLTLDFICHGVPSPKVWRKYLNEVICTTCNSGRNSVSISLNEISHISFRDKKFGWEKFGFKVCAKPINKIEENKVSKSGVHLYNGEEVCFETLDKNLYLQGFINDVILRPSCYACPTKKFKSGSDITLADYWGINEIDPEFNDDKGTSLLLVHNPDVDKLIELLDIIYKSISFDAIVKYNPSAINSVSIPKRRDELFKKIDNKKLLKLSSLLYLPFIIRMKIKVRSIMDFLLLRRISKL